MNDVPFTADADAADTADTADADAAERDRRAFDATEPLRRAANAVDFPPYNLDAFYAAGKALWLVPRVAPYREQMLALPGFDIAHLDRSEDLARALRYVQTEIRGWIQRRGQIPGIAAEGWRLRRMMMSYAEALSFKGLVAPELIARLREGSGYRDLVEDLSVLVRLLQALPASHTGPDAAVNRADLTRASEIAHALNVHVGNGVDANAAQATRLDDRRKLGGLLLASHDQLRRAVTYLRWAEGDASALVPSLYASGRKPRKADDPPETAPIDADETQREQLHSAVHAVLDPAAAAPVDASDRVRRS